MQTHRCSVDAEHAGMRLDKFLAGELPHLSRARLQQLIAEGLVLRGDAPIGNASQKIKAGDLFTITEPEVRTHDLTPANIPLSIIYEDDDLLVIDKPPGMTVHPAPGAYADTLVHALLHHCGSSLSGIGGVSRPGIVHRIDKDTSGLLVVAKHDRAHQHLSAQLATRTLSRSYLAFTWAALMPRHGTIDAPIARNQIKRQQMAVAKPHQEGRASRTHYHTEATYIPAGSITPLASKVICELETGRTHQIRVHLTHMKCSLIGDPTYGLSTDSRLKRIAASGIVLPEETLFALRNIHRQALHAKTLRFLHLSGEEMTFEAPVPADLAALETGLGFLTKTAS